MACNGCSKTFSLFRSEKGCPSCGFSYCSKCLKYKVFSKKLSSEVMVCAKCKAKQTTNLNEPKKIEPPDAYYKRIAITESDAESGSTNDSSVEKEILERLKKLKEDKEAVLATTSTDTVADRLQKLKGEVPSTSDAELRARLANIRGVPLSTLDNKPLVPTISANKTEQEQVEELMKQYIEQGSIDNKYEEEFDQLVTSIEARLQKLKSAHNSQTDKVPPQDNNDSENEEETIKKIIEKVKAEARLENDLNTEPVMEELPFCEICNEDAKMRCLGCKYLFCKQCFKDHEDDDDGCDKFEPYSPPKNFVM